MNDDAITGNQEDIVFKTSDILALLAHLTNATMLQNGAIMSMTAEDRPETYRLLAAAGDQVDIILKTFRERLGEGILRE